jgi:hypothetical protein
MPYQFHCPQGHVLQAEMSMIGQLLQCPMCGTGFLVPAPDCGVTMTVTPQTPAPAPAQPETQPATDEKPPFDLGFDPLAKSALPFDLPGQRDSTAGAPAAGSFLAGPLAVTPLPAATFPAPSSPASTFAAAPLPAAAMPAAPMESVGAGSDFLANAPAAQEEPPPPPPRLLHIRCPSGHVVKAPSDLLGKNGRCPACKKTFELRYENSIEFQRRTEKILHRDQTEAGRAWLGWVFVAAFLIFVALVGAVILLGR